MKEAQLDARDAAEPICLNPLLYRPRGAAGEYAALALRGPYRGCGHGCKYCYVPGCQRMSREQWLQPRPLKDFARRLESLPQAADPVPVFISFACDPYQPLERRLRLTRLALEGLLAAGWRVRLLTKGIPPLEDLDLLAAHPGCEVWVTLTGLGVDHAERWEPGAALPLDRIRLLREARARGIHTGISLEPVIVPARSLEALRLAADHTDFVAVGRLNHFSLARAREIEPGLEPVDWPAARRQIETELRRLGFSPCGLRPPRRGRHYLIKQTLK
jgi:DNA repair photolyase